MRHFLPRIVVLALSVMSAFSILTKPSRASAQTNVSVTNIIPITFSGEVRARSEWDKPGGSLSADQFTYLRTRLGIKVDATSYAHLMMQVQDSRVLGGEGNPLTAASTLFDLHQAYVELSATWHHVQYAVRAGRQEMPLANERIVGASNWTNTGRSFDGVRLRLTPNKAPADTESWTLSAFALTVEEHGRHFGTTGDEASTVKQPDQSLVGLYATRRAETSHLGVVDFEGTALYDVGSNYRAYHNANRGTLDGHLHIANVSGLRAELEGALQFGRQRYAPDTLHVQYQNVGAWLLGARIGTAENSDTRTSVALGVDVLSGDATPSDNKYSAFSTLFASNHQFYGLQDIIGDPAASTKERGLIDAFANGSQRLSKNVSLKAELHHFSLATGSNAALAWEADVTLPLHIGSAVNFDVGYSLFHSDSGAAAVGLGANGNVKHWVFLSLRAGF